MDLCCCSTQPSFRSSVFPQCMALFAPLLCLRRTVCRTHSGMCLLFLPLCYSFYLCASLSTSVLLFLPLCYSFYFCATLSTSVLLFLSLCCSFCLCAALYASVLLFMPLCCSFYFCVTLSVSVLLFLPLCCSFCLCATACGLADGVSVMWTLFTFLFLLGLMSDNNPDCSHREWPPELMWLSANRDRTFTVCRIL